MMTLQKWIFVSIFQSLLCACGSSSTLFNEKLNQPELVSVVNKYEVSDQKITPSAIPKNARVIKAALERSADQSIRLRFKWEFQTPSGVPSENIAYWWQIDAYDETVHLEGHQIYPDGTNEHLSEPLEVGRVHKFQVGLTALGELNGAFIGGEMVFCRITVDLRSLGR